LTKAAKGTPVVASTTSIGERVTEIPEVSFIMAAHNVAPYIEAAIASALNQSMQSIEIIVVDDGSSDDTAKRVESIARIDSRVRLIRIPVRSGASIARNRAIAAARGNWIAVLDADDLIAPERTKALLYLAASCECDIVADNSMRFEDQTGIKRTSILDPGPAQYAFFVGPEDLLHSNHMFSSVAGTGYLKPLIRTSLLKQFGILYDETVTIGEDFLLCLDCLLKGARYCVTSQAYYYYRIRSHSTSRRINSNEIEQLLAAHRERSTAFRASPALSDAANRYASALDRALGLTHFVEALKRYRLKEVLRLGLQRPDIWVLLCRFGLEAVTNRLPNLWAGLEGTPQQIDLTDLRVEMRSSGGDTSDVGRIAIGVCTYRRPKGLLSLLKAIDRQELGSIDPENIVIVVVDNDPNQSARPTLAYYAEHGRFTLYASPERDKGLANARNRLLATAREQHVDKLIVIDDDSIPDGDWLARFCRLGEAAASLGPVFPLFLKTPPNWAVKGGFYSIRKESVSNHNGTISSGFIGNALLSMATVDKEGLRFDPKYNETGGEDTLFFQALLNTGHPINWIESAGIWETIPEHRMTVSWLVSRWFRTGNTEASLCVFGDNSVLGRGVNALRGIGRLWIGGTLVIVASLLSGWHDPSAIIARLYTVSRGAGLLASAFGKQYREYSHSSYRR
jgi:succinoglycan biosynthesis protein ExoM